VLRFACELLPPLVLGLLLGLRQPELPGRLVVPLVRWGVPVSLVGLLLRAGLHAELLVAALMAGLANTIGLLLLQRIGPLKRAIPSPSLRLGSVVGNTGYFGIPVAMALLPAQALGFSITYDLVGTFITWTIGPVMVQGKPADLSQGAAALAASPAFRGLAVALLLQLSPWAELVGRLLWWPSQLLLLLALSVVGMRLGVTLGQRRGAVLELRGARALGVALAVKLLALPILVLALGQLARLSPLVRDALVLQAAAPTAISALLLAELVGRDGEATAQLVLASTLLALGSVPLWWLVLGRLPGG
jgi:predicted permease